MSEVFLFDIEGTTTDINFVHKILFPYSTERIKEFVLKNAQSPEVARAISEVKKTVLTENQKEINLNEVTEVLLKWIKEDRKHGALKEIQGFIWKEGYEQGHFKGHVYPDVKPYFQKLVDSGKRVGIYSSGSVGAQKLIMKYSDAGDLTPFISFYFDTQVGGKREPISYLNIAREINLSPEKIQFYSDIAEELEAAEAAGMKPVQLLREGTKPSRFTGIKQF